LKAGTYIMMEVIPSHSGIQHQKLPTRDELLAAFNRADEALARATRGLNRQWSHGRLKVWIRCSERFDAAFDAYEAGLA
jgi:hypothetical protein